MVKTTVYNISAKSIGQTELPKEIFDAKINESLMAQAVRVYLSNQRKSRAKAKNRGEIQGSTRKIYRQKGTGRARHGDKYAPIFVGGGKAHGPTGQENYKLRMPKKMRRQALFSALTSKLKAKEIMVVDGLVKIKPKTKEMAKVLAKLNPGQTKKKLKISLILAAKMENATRAAKNISGVQLKQADSLNTYEVLNTNQLIFSKESIKKMKEVYCQ